MKTQSDGAALQAQVATIGDRITFEPSPAIGKDGLPLGYKMLVGQFATQADAATHAEKLKALSSTASAYWTGNNGHPTTGPYVVHMLIIDPARYRGQIKSVLANQAITTGALLQQISQDQQAIAAINGGYFSSTLPTYDPPAVLSPVDLFVSAGNLVSKSTPLRPTVLFRFDDNKPSATILNQVQTQSTASDKNGSAINIDAINAVRLGQPGVEMVLFNQYFGPTQAGTFLSNPNTTTYQLTLDKKGHVIASGTILDGNLRAGDNIILQGIGKAATWLSHHSTLGTRLEITTILKSANKTIDLTPNTYMLQAGPSLAPAYQFATLSNQEGFGVTNVDGKDRSAIYDNFFVGRHPRTAIGVMADGKIIFVVVDGRQPNYSAGASLPEMAALMQFLNVTQGINLDGGGSSEMIIAGKLKNIPSNRHADGRIKTRTISNAIILQADDH